MESVTNITPYSAAELTRKYFKWKDFVQERLDKCIPCYCWKGLRSGTVTIPLLVDVTPLDAINIVEPILKELGWKPTKPEFNHPNNELHIVVEW